MTEEGFYGSYLLGQMCRIATEILADSVYVPDQRGNYMFRGWVDEVTNIQLLDLMERLDMLLPSERYQAFELVAAEADLSDWSCPAIQQIFSP